MKSASNLEMEQAQAAINFEFLPAQLRRFVGRSGCHQQRQHTVQLRHAVQASRQAIERQRQATRQGGAAGISSSTARALESKRRRAQASTVTTPDACGGQGFEAFQQQAQAGTGLSVGQFRATPA